jgi:hypothetical protein
LIGDSERRFVGDCSELLQLAQEQSERNWQCTTKSLKRTLADRGSNACRHWALPSQANLRATGIAAARNS